MYTAKKLEFAGMRAQVCKLWSQGEVVQCGAITNPTRLVFRSASAHVLLFLQISSEMWAFDASGEDMLLLVHTYIIAMNVLAQRYMYVYV